MKTPGKFVMCLGVLLACAPVLGQSPHASALHAAVRQGRVEQVRQLLEAGAAVDAVNKRGQTPLLVAVGDGGNQPAQRAARRQIARLLLAAGADVNAANREKMTALHLALARQRGGMVGLLLEAGADVNAVDRWGRVPLHWAALAGDRKSVLELTRRGAAVGAVDAAGNTPLHLAAARGQVETIATLLELKADVQLANKRGRSPLAVLATAPVRGPQGEQRLVQAARLLLAAGADVNQRDARQTTPRALAEQAGHAALADYLARKGGEK